MNTWDEVRDFLNEAFSEPRTHEVILSKVLVGNTHKWGQSFDGKEGQEIRPFLQNLRRLLRVSNICVKKNLDQIWVWLHLVLKGSALRWYSEYKEEWSCYEDFESYALCYFDDPDPFLEIEDLDDEPDVAQPQTLSQGNESTSQSEVRKSSLPTNVTAPPAIEQSASRKNGGRTRRRDSSKPLQCSDCGNLGFSRKHCPDCKQAEEISRSGYSREESCHVMPTVKTDAQEVGGYEARSSLCQGTSSKASTEQTVNSQKICHLGCSREESCHVTPTVETEAQAVDRWLALLSAMKEAREVPSDVSRKRKSSLQTEVPALPAIEQNASRQKAGHTGNRDFSKPLRCSDCGNLGFSREHCPDCKQAEEISRSGHSREESCQVMPTGKTATQEVDGDGARPSLLQKTSSRESMGRTVNTRKISHSGGAREESCHMTFTGESKGFDNCQTLSPTMEMVRELRDRSSRQKKAPRKSAQVSSEVTCPQESSTDRRSREESYHVAPTASTNIPGPKSSRACPLQGQTASDEKRDNEISSTAMPAARFKVNLRVQKVTVDPKGDSGQVIATSRMRPRRELKDDEKCTRQTKGADVKLGNRENRFAPTLLGNIERPKSLLQSPTTAQVSVISKVRIAHSFAAKFKVRERIRGDSWSITDVNFEHLGLRSGRDDGRKGVSHLYRVLAKMKELICVRYWNINGKDAAFKSEDDFSRPPKGAVAKSDPPDACDTSPREDEDGDATVAPSPVIASDANVTIRAKHTRTCVESASRKAQASLLIMERIKVSLSRMTKMSKSWQRDRSRSKNNTGRRTYLRRKYSHHYITQMSTAGDTVGHRPRRKVLRRGPEERPRFRDPIRLHDFSAAKTEVLTSRLLGTFVPTESLIARTYSIIFLLSLRDKQSLTNRQYYFLYYKDQRRGLRRILLFKSMRRRRGKIKQAGAQISSQRA